MRDVNNYCQAIGYSYAEKITSPNNVYGVPCGVYCHPENGELLVPDASAICQNKFPDQNTVYLRASQGAGCYAQQESNSL